MLRIVTDSVASLPKDLVKERNIEVASLYVHHNGQEYVDADMDVDKFYSGLADMLDNIPTSSQPSQQTFRDIFENAACAGDNVLCIFISQLMSGTLQGAMRAAQDCKLIHPDFRCIFVDSTTNSADEGFAVLDAADARDAGKNLDECALAALLAIKCSRFLFAPETLEFLKAGGRIGAAAALLGNLLQIVPILTVSNGEAKAFAPTRTKKKAAAKMAATLQEDIEAHGLKRVVVHYIGNAEPAQKWAKEVIEPLVGRAVPVLPVSPVIGVHTGPSIGVAYECNSALDGKFSGSITELLFQV